VWSAATLAPSFSALEADVAAQLAPVRGIERSQLRADWHRYAVSSDHRRIIDAGGRYPRSSWASVSESDGGTRLSFPSIDPGHEVFQTNAAVGLCHGRASLQARRLRGPCPAGRWSSPAPPPCSSRPFLPKLHLNVLLFTTTRIAFMAYLSSLTGMRRLARLRLSDDAHKLFDWIRGGRRRSLVAWFRRPVRVFGLARALRILRGPPRVLSTCLARAER